ncbi:hypothetical protein AVEN_194225-1 [Araneus ventricosus]|uniref:Uncharacterized protein n=1 Tax=Araneus ventricosus TaxID=182803 RepID=A0A4Y2HGJ8_ARAVE|nr:hypothetical protein AVEN_194225-1 [Araneus ventricosus]
MNNLRNLYDLAGVYRRGEADILPRPQDSRTVKGVAWRQFSLRTMSAVRVRSFAVPIYPHTFKVGDYQSCNCLRYVSFFSSLCFLSLDFTTALSHKM